LDIGAMASFAGLIALPVWFAVCAIGPKMGLLEGHYALDTLTLSWGLALSILVLAIAAGSGVLLILARRYDREWPQGSWVVAASLVVALLAFALTLLGGVRQSAHPAVTEVTTDAEQPPGFTSALILRRGVHAHRVSEGDFHPDMMIEAVQFDAPPEAVFDAVLGIARDARWRVGTVARNRLMVELTIESFWYAQTDDVVIAIRETQAGGSRLDYRASARAGVRDGGRNARRLARLEREIRVRLERD
jgi:hypothetical protein